MDIEVKPQFYNAKNQIVPIEGLYKNSSCFLVLSGPSLKTLDLSKLTQPGIVTFGVNNSPRIFRPNFWTLVDTPGNFMISIWKDPRIMKFAPYPKLESRLFDNTTWKDSDKVVKECPNVMYYYRNEKFNHETFLTEDTINWGCHKDYGGGRSVFLASLRIMFLLGFTNVYLLGCDFKMELGKPNYAFEQQRSKSSVNNNNNTYKLLNERFDLLKPLFEKENFHIWNCTPESGLKTFPYIEYNEALTTVLKDFPDTKTERTEGMYERNSDKEKKKKEIKKKLDDKRAFLDQCKVKRTEYDGDDPDIIKTLDKAIAEARKEFRITEKEKNKIWEISKK
jgi:hypothetical protein